MGGRSHSLSGWRLACAATFTVAATQAEPLGAAVEDKAARLGHQPAAFTDVIGVPEGIPWLFSIATPLAVMLNTEESPQVLVAMAAQPSEAGSSALGRLGPRRGLFLVPGTDPGLTASLEKIPARVIAVGANPTLAGLRVASEFWGRAEEAILAPVNQAGAVILGSALAAHLKVPFIPVGDMRDGPVLLQGLNNLGVKKPMVAVDDRQHIPAWMESLPDQTEVLDVPALQQRLIERIGASNVRNVILCRVGDAQGADRSACWAAAYLSAYRRAPVVFSLSADGLEAEASVEAFLRTGGLRPQNLTILADLATIGMISVGDPARLGEYQVEVEPCSRPDDGLAAELGVGRIPAGTLAEASLLIASGQVRERYVSRRPPRAVMIANPKTQYEPMPLAETVSRLTAKEFRNVGIHVDEFYGWASDDPELVRAAAESNVLIYEGHVSDMAMFAGGSISTGEYEDYGREEWETAEQSDDRTGPSSDRDGNHGEPAGSQSGAAGAVNHGAKRQAGPQGSDKARTGAAELQEAMPPPDHADMARARLEQFEAFPLVILQSCHSLKEDRGQEVLGLGGVGVVGTVSGIHSASGSALVKALCDGMLYRGDTVGEALRDARNYCLGLGELKSRRGHSEQSKVMRTALGFCLWGDPELRLFPGEGYRAKDRPVSATLVGPGQLRIAIPGRRLPACQTDKYEARMFPGSQAAGMVRKIKGKEHRRLMPLYFFRLPLPAGSGDLRPGQGRPNGDASPQTVLLTDRFRRYVYVLHLPDKQEEQADFVIKLPEGLATADAPGKQGDGQ